jgi:hypothetical protein
VFYVTRDRRIRHRTTTWKCELHKRQKLFPVFFTSERHGMPWWRFLVCLLAGKKALFRYPRALLGTLLPLKQERATYAFIKIDAEFLALRWKTLTVRANQCVRVIIKRDSSLVPISKSKKLNFLSSSKKYIHTYMYTYMHVFSVSVLCTVYVVAYM